MARTRRRYSNKFVRSDAQATVVDAAASEQIPHRAIKNSRANNIPTCLHVWPKFVAVAPLSAQGNHLWPGIQDASTHQKFRPEAVSVIAPAKGTPCWSEDILMEILSTLWLADLSPRARRAFLRSVPLVCRYWLQACSRIFLTNTYIVSPRTDLFEPLRFKNLLGDSSSEGITRTYTRQLPAPKFPPTYRHLEISRHIAMRYQDTGCAALPGTQGTAIGALPASLLRDAIDTFRHLEYMPNLSELVMEYREHRDTDAAPLHRATFRVVHIAVEYHFFSHRDRDGNEDSSSYASPTQHWIAEELGLLPTSVSRAAKRDHLLNTLPDLNLISFASPHAYTHCDDPIILRAIGDMISMGAGSVSTSKVDDGRSIGVSVHGGLQGLEGNRFALVHGALNKNTCKIGSIRNQHPYVITLHKRQEWQNMPFEKSQKCRPSKKQRYKFRCVLFNI